MKRTATFATLSAMAIALLAPGAMADTNKFWACKYGEFYNVKTAHCVSCKTYVTDEVALAKCKSCKGGMTWDVTAKKCTHFGGGVVR